MATETTIDVDDLDGAAPEAGSVFAASQADDSRVMLARTRDLVARCIDNPATHPRDLAALVLKLVVLDEKIRGLDEQAQVAAVAAEAERAQQAKKAATRSQRATSSGFNLAAL